MDFPRLSFKLRINTTVFTMYIELSLFNVAILASQNPQSRLHPATAGEGVAGPFIHELLQNV